MAKRKQTAYRVQLTPEAKNVLTDTSKSLGLKQMRLTGQIMEWFAAQPETIQAAVLGLYPDAIKEKVAGLILKEMESGNG